jgi:hypothetical protein
MSAALLYAFAGTDRCSSSGVAALVLQAHLLRKHPRLQSSWAAVFS